MKVCETLIDDSNRQTSLVLQSFGLDTFSLCHEIIVDSFQFKSSLKMNSKSLSSVRISSTSDTRVSAFMAICITSPSGVYSCYKFEVHFTTEAEQCCSRVLLSFALFNMLHGYASSGDSWITYLAWLFGACLVLG